MRFKVQIAKVATFLLCTVCILCIACGNEAVATTMKLTRTEGKVSVRDEKEKELTPAEEMKLYSGYRLETEKEAYSWIDLDSVKLAKMDEESCIEIQKTGKDLEILLNSGSLFFNVTEPLEEDETFDIRTSTMAVGIRGTCGWVSVAEEGQMYVCILEGTVECSVTDPDTGEVLTKAVTEGERARIVWKDGKAEIIVEKFMKKEIPPFVTEEIEKDPGLAEQIETILAANAEPVILTANINELEFLSGNGAGNVIITVRDGLYGAINLNGEEIVPNKYSGWWWVPNNEGQFILADGDTAVVFDNQGNVILEIPEAVNVYVAENAVTYGRLVGEWSGEVGCYDIMESRYTIQIGFEDEYRLGLSNGYGIRVTGMQGGTFWYSNIGEQRLYQVQKDKGIIWTDEDFAAELFAIWEAEELEAELNRQKEEEQWGDTWANMGGMSSFMYDSGGPLHNVNDSYIICHPWLEASYFRIFDCNVRRSILFDVYNENMSDSWQKCDSFYVPSYFDDGRIFANREQQVVMRGYSYEGESIACFLIDFSSAEVDKYGDVTNLPELILAEYPYIGLAGDGWYKASDGEILFYLDEHGNRVNSEQWVSCSAFYGGHALVLEDDGMAYIVDKSFEKITEGYPADSVSLAGGMFYVLKGDEQTLIYIP